MSQTKVYQTAELEIGIREQAFVKEQSSVKSDEGFVFPEIGLIPRTDLIFRISSWDMSEIKIKPDVEFYEEKYFPVRSLLLPISQGGGVLIRVELTLFQKSLIQQHPDCRAKILMGYEVDYEMSEGEVLQAAAKAKIRRNQDNSTGYMIYGLDFDLRRANFFPENDVNVHDLYKISHGHKNSIGPKLPANTNIHFFPDIKIKDLESGKIKLRASHMTLRNANDGLVVAASRFVSGHKIKKGDICIFAHHPAVPIPNLN